MELSKAPRLALTSGRGVGTSVLRGGAAGGRGGGGGAGGMEDAPRIFTGTFLLKECVKRNRK